MFEKLKGGLNVAKNIASGGIKGAATAVLEGIKAKIKIWATIVAISALLITCIIVGPIQEIGQWLQNKWNSIKGTFGTRYTISDTEAKNVMDQMKPMLKDMGYSDESMKGKEDDIKYYIAAQYNSYKPFGGATLNKTATYTVEDPKPGFTQPGNESTPITFGEKDKIAPYVLGAEFYLAMDVGTQNTAFARACGETSSRGGFEMTKDDATFTDIYNEVKTVTTVQWKKPVYKTVPVDTIGSIRHNSGYSVFAAMNYVPIYDILNSKNLKMAYKTDDGGDPWVEPGTDPGTEPGTDPGTEPGTEPGTDPGTNPPPPETKEVLDHYEDHTMVITKVEKIPNHVLTNVRSWSKQYTWNYEKGTERHEVVSDDGTTKIETYTTNYELTSSGCEDNTTRFEQLARMNYINPEDFAVPITILQADSRNSYTVQDLKYVQDKLMGKVTLGSYGSAYIDLPNIPLQPGDSAAADAELKKYPLPQLYQHDERWGSIMYSSTNNPEQTIAASGCGPSSCAIVLTGMTKQPITPPLACRFSLDNGYRTVNSGTSWGFFPAYAKTFGINVTSITLSESEKSNFRLNGIESDNIKAIKQALTNQDPMVISQSAGYWTSGGHFHVWGGFDSQGKVIIIDPNRKSGHFDLGMAIENVAAVFIFTK